MGKVDRNLHLTTIAKQSIEDAVEEAYNKRNETLAREGDLSYLPNLATIGNISEIASSLS